MVLVMVDEGYGCWVERKGGKVYPRDLVICERMILTAVQQQLPIHVKHEIEDPKWPNPMVVRYIVKPLGGGG